MSLRTAWAVLFVFLASTAFAAYTIDGYDNDWVSGYGSQNVDGDEKAVVPKYDIWVNRSGLENDYWYFYYRTMDYYPTGNPGDFSQIWIDADGDAATGGSYGNLTGFEYRLEWDLGHPTLEHVVADASLWAWDDSRQTFYDTGSLYPAARGLAANTGVTGREMFTEWSVPGSALGNPRKIYWGARLDDKGSSADDMCPDDLRQPHDPTPELTPLSLLMVFGCLGLVFRRRSAG